MSQAEDEQPLASHEEAAILAALEAALRPTELDPRLNERFIAWALEDPLAPASPEELVESERLRDALAGDVQHEATDLLAALRAPFGDESAPAMERALQAALATPATAPRKRANVVYVAFGAASTLLAAAAAIALLIGAPLRRPAPSMAAVAPPQLVKPHTTAGLFAEPFEVGSTTARMDRIASARSRELRDNRYTAWGVR